VGQRVTSCHGVNQTMSNAHKACAGSGECVVFTADDHSIPFEYQLPHDLPSSYSGRWGQVKYVIKAKLQRHWKFDIDRETDLIVKSLVDLNEEPELAVSTLSTLLLLVISCNEIIYKYNSMLAVAKPGDAMAEGLDLSVSRYSILIMRVQTANSCMLSWCYLGLI